MAQLILPGTTIPAHVLTGDTFSAGTNYGAAGTMTNNGSQTFTPGITDITGWSGYFSSLTVKGDPNLTASNIANGVAIFGVTGTLVAGTPFASGTATSSSGTLTFVDSGTNPHVNNYVTVSGLTFTPKFIFLINASSGTDFVIYDSYEIFTNTNGSIYSKYIGVYFQLTGSASVTSTGFQLPVGAASASYKWRAWG